MADKPINLISLINANEDLTNEAFQAYIEKMGIKLRASELEDITSLVQSIKAHTGNSLVFNNYYIGFTINQIGKEFDLLRLGEEYIINIELKKKNTGEKIRNQLIKNRYYLQALERKVLNFTFVVDENSLYFLEEDNSISEINFDILVDMISKQEILNIQDINNLFDPTNYLVSPFNSTERFIEDKYFLTHHQDSIKDQLFELSSTSTNRLFSIQGSAGTGKTLLTYDLAKDFISNEKKVMVIHCGNLNSGHNRLIENYSWNIIPVKNYEQMLSGHYDLIIIDEVQRIYKNQLEKIISYSRENGIACIFSYDPNQCLHISEIRNNIPSYLESIVNKEFKLTEKIRTNTELTAFIKNLFDLSKRNPQQNYSNIEIQYFTDIENANSYIYSKKLKGWTTINYTVSRYKYSSLDYMNVFANENAHSVIGQEFDNVVAVIGNTFHYNSQGLLMGDRASYYHPTKMLFQILTRTRKKLCLVIIKNEALLKKCLEILH